ncbi:hypothetical protein [Achromobacter xylosoxidans]|nr:hypothetical protein [Achromobacter xylosoxidans]
MTQVSGWAYGAFLLWQSVTLGWQDPRDVQRLLALAESLENVGAEHGGHV